ARAIAAARRVAAPVTHLKLCCCRKESATVRLRHRSKFRAETGRWALDKSSPPDSTQRDSERCGTSSGGDKKRSEGGFSDGGCGHRVRARACGHRSWRNALLGAPHTAEASRAVAEARRSGVSRGFPRHAG